MYDIYVSCMSTSGLVMDKVLVRFDFDFDFESDDFSFKISETETLILYKDFDSGFGFKIIFNRVLPLNLFIFYIRAGKNDDFDSNSNLRL